MSQPLDKATEQFRAGQYKRAVDTLWEVSFAGDDGEELARGVIALATQLREVTDGRLRQECAQLIGSAERLLLAEQQAATATRVARAEAELREDPVRLARWARDACLTWLEVDSDEDLVAAQLRAALAAEGGSGGAPPCVIDQVEAEGWRLTHVSRLFRPTKLQTSPLRGAEFFLGADVVEGVETHHYVFRRANDPT